MLGAFGWIVWQLWPTGTTTFAATSGSGSSVLSYRRAPHWVAKNRSDSQFSEALGALVLSKAPAQMCLRAEIGGRTLVSINSSLPLLPASNMKVLTGFGVLARLKPDSTFRTSVRASTPVAGTVVGNLYLVGGGDPLLATPEFVSQYARSKGEDPVSFTDLTKLADKVFESGIRSISGSVIGDDSRFDAQRYLPSWKSSYAYLAEIGPQSALSVNDGLLSIGPPAIPASDPAAHAAAVFAGLLEQRGIAIGAPPSSGVSETTVAEVAAIESAPVSEVVQEMLESSDNLTAELLAKEVSVNQGVNPGSTGVGVALIRESLAQAGLPLDGFATVDASGLDRSDRATCDLLQAVLDRVGSQSLLAQGFPVAGKTGTLQNRFQSNPATGRLRAKTGALSGVTALSGWVDRLDDVSVGFSMLANGSFSDLEGKQLQEDLGAVLATPPAPVDVSLLAPLSQ